MCLLWLISYEPAVKRLLLIAGLLTAVLLIGTAGFTLVEGWPGIEAGDLLIAMGERTKFRSPDPEEF